MTDQEYLRACGWYAHGKGCSCCSDGEVYWSCDSDDDKTEAEAVAIQTKRDRDRFLFVVAKTEEDDD